MMLVIDTSIIVATLLTREKYANASHIFDQFSIKKVQLALCKETFEELRRVITSVKSKRYSSYNSRLIAQFINQYKHNAHMFDIKDISVDCNLRDETDRKFLQLAVASNADYLITGDNDLLELENIKGTKIVKPAVFITENRDEK